MTQERLFFNGFAEAMVVRPYGAQLSTRAKQRLRERGLDLEAKLHCRLEAVEGPGARFVCTWDG